MKYAAYMNELFRKSKLKTDRYEITKMKSDGYIVKNGYETNVLTAENTCKIDIMHKNECAK